MTQAELWEKMMDDKIGGTFPYLQAFATLSRDVNHLDVHWKKGDRVRVVMASRLGDVGLTKNLSARNGYDYRDPCVEMTFPPPVGTIKPDVTDLLTDIELIPNRVSP